MAFMCMKISALGQRSRFWSAFIMTDIRNRADSKRKRGPEVSFPGVSYTPVQVQEFYKNSVFCISDKLSVQIIKKNQ